MILVYDSARENAQPSLACAVSYGEVEITNMHARYEGGLCTGIYEHKNTAYWNDHCMLCYGALSPRNNKVFSLSCVCECVYVCVRVFKGRVS